MRRRYSYLFFSVILVIYNESAISQINIMGKPGYINTPSAKWMEPLGVSFAHLPGNYSMFGNELTDVNFYNTRAAFTSFFEVNLSVAHRPARAQIKNLGIGDRHLDLRFLIFNERKYFPSIVLGWTPPGSSAPYLSHDYLVLTKKIQTNLGSFQFTSGYGSPYVFLKDNSSNAFLEFKVERKSDGNLKTSYLTGFFGAISYEPIHLGGIMMEYDSNTFNAGAYIKPWDWLNIQAYSYEGKDWGFSAALNFSLDFSPYSIRKHEKAQN